MCWYLLGPCYRIKWIIFLTTKKNPSLHRWMAQVFTRGHYSCAWIANVSQLFRILQCCYTGMFRAIIWNVNAAILFESLVCHIFYGSIIHVGKYFILFSNMLMIFIEITSKYILMVEVKQNNQTYCIYIALKNYRKMINSNLRMIKQSLLSAKKRRNSKSEVLKFWK